MLIMLFIWFIGFKNTKFSSGAVSNSASFKSRSKKLKTNNLSKSTHTTKSIDGFDCLKFLNKKAGTDKCGLDCYAKEIQESGYEELEDILAEGWWKKRSAKSAPARSRLGRLYEALDLAHALETSHGEKPALNMALAEAKMKELANESGENTFIYYFLAAILSKAGKKEEAKKLLNQVIEDKNNHFVSYVQDAAFRLRWGSLGNLQNSLNANEVYSRLPMPDYSILLNLIELDPEIAVKMGQQFVQASLSHQGKHSDTLWIPGEHAIGKKVLEVVSPVEGMSIPSYQELIDQSPPIQHVWGLNNPSECTVIETEKTQSKYREEIEEDIEATEYP